MKTEDLKIIHEKVSHDDDTLMKMYFAASNEFRKRKSIFDKVCKVYDENDYFSFAITKLKYQFAKDEYNLLRAETAERGLIL